MELAREPASFWQEKGSIVARTSYQMYEVLLFWDQKRA